MGKKTNRSKWQEAPPYYNHPTWYQIDLEGPEKENRPYGTTFDLESWRSMLRPWPKDFDFLLASEMNVSHFPPLRKARLRDSNLTCCAETWNKAVAPIQCCTRAAIDFFCISGYQSYMKIRENLGLVSPSALENSIARIRQDLHHTQKIATPDNDDVLLFFYFVPQAPLVFEIVLEYLRPRERSWLGILTRFWTCKKGRPGHFGNLLEMACASKVEYRDFLSFHGQEICRKPGMLIHRFFSVSYNFPFWRQARIGGVVEATLLQKLNLTEILSAVTKALCAERGIALRTIYILVSALEKKINLENSQNAKFAHVNSIANSAGRQGETIYVLLQLYQVILTLLRFNTESGLKAYIGQKICHPMFARPHLLPEWLQPVAVQAIFDSVWVSIDEEQEFFQAFGEVCGGLWSLQCRQGQKLPFIILTAYQMAIAQDHISGLTHAIDEYNLTIPPSTWNYEDKYFADVKDDHQSVTSTASTVDIREGSPLDDACGQILEQHGDFALDPEEKEATLRRVEPKKKRKLEDVEELLPKNVNVPDSDEEEEEILAQDPREIFIDLTLSPNQ